MMWFAISSGGILSTPGKSGKRAAQIQYNSGAYHYHADILSDSKVQAPSRGMNGDIHHGLTIASGTILERVR